MRVEQYNQTEPRRPITAYSALQLLDVQHEEQDELWYEDHGQTLFGPW